MTIVESSLVRRRAGSVIVLTTTMLVLPTVAWPQSSKIDWVRQLGTSSGDYSRGVSADGLGNVYISGLTNGSLGEANAGPSDAFVSKYDDAGNIQWVRQLGTSSDDQSNGVSADGLGNVYISGLTRGSLGEANAGSSDAFVSKYDDAGNIQWVRQLGTSSDQSNGVSADGLGNVYISGVTEGTPNGTHSNPDAFVSKYDDAGDLQWTRQLGTHSDDISFGVSADGLGNVYISGFTKGRLEGTNAGMDDAFVSKYDAAGDLQWTRQLGTSSIDSSLGVSADGLGNVYISGFTGGSLDGTKAGSADAFVSKYDAAGDLQWTRQLGTSSADQSFGVSADGLGNVYISGETLGSLDGTNAGAGDAFVSKYDAAGDLQWTRQLGTSSDDVSSGVSADGLGNVYISGFTSGSLDRANNGSPDAFLAKVIRTPLGDMDIDGDIDFDDIDDFVLGLNNASDYFDLHRVSPILHGDVNRDSFFDFDDIAGFVELLANASASSLQTIPEPSTILLVAVALVVLAVVKPRE